MNRSENMSRIKSKGTSIEVALGKSMWSAGLRYRKNDKTVIGKPDFVFKKKKVAIFCDSEFWHGKKYLNGEKFKTNTAFWEKKIMRNIERDKEVNETLKSNGWIVVRFWGESIKKDINGCLNRVLEVLI
ncbi:MAG TPA: very short patch repair endonuclease [Sulfuricurvum sp.]|nr:very short patch repair endonuclease [Sulfuricurvum sp.]